MVLTIEQQQDFIRDGYLRVTDVFTDDQTRQLRAAMERIFDSPSPYEGDSDTGRADIFCRYQELRWVLVHPPLVRVLKDLLGEDFVYIHEMSGHQNVFSPWHKDTTSVELRGNSFHWKPNYLMVECAIYLQDNDGRGGGLTVLPGSHNLYDRYKARAQGAPMQNGYAAVEQVGAPPRRRNTRQAAPGFQPGRASARSGPGRPVRWAHRGRDSRQGGGRGSLSLPHRPPRQ